MIKGKITALNDKGFGFIETNDKHQSVYFHCSQLLNMSFNQYDKDLAPQERPQNLKEGMEVEIDEIKQEMKFDKKLGREVLKSEAFGVTVII